MNNSDFYKMIIFIFLFIALVYFGFMAFLSYSTYGFNALPANNLISPFIKV